MTDEKERPGTSGADVGSAGEPTLAALFGFDPADERADDVSDNDSARLRALFADAVGEEPAGGPTPLGIIAAATRSERAQAALEQQERADRRGRVIKGVLIAAAVAVVVVVVPVALRGGSSSDSASSVMSVEAGATAAAGTSAAATSGASGFDTGSQAGAGQAGAVASEAMTSGASSAAESSAAASAADGRSPDAASAPTAEAAPSSSAAAPPATSAATSAGSAATDGKPAQAPTAAESAGGTDGVGQCVWPELKPAVVAAALKVLGLPTHTTVTPASGPCLPGRVGGVTIPEAGVTVLAYRGKPATFTLSTQAVTTSGRGLTVTVIPAGYDSWDSSLSPSERAGLARAVLDSAG